MRGLTGCPLNRRPAPKLDADYTVNIALMNLREWQDIVRNFKRLAALASLSSDNEIHRGRMVVDLIRVGIESVANNNICLQLKDAQ